MNKLVLKRIGMRNKFVIFIMLIFEFLFVSNSIYGQDKNNIFFNIGSPTTPDFTQWTIGLGYERALNEKFSFVVTNDFAWWTATIADSSYGEENRFEIDILAHFRYYPFTAHVGKLFLDIGMGYTFLSITTWETKISNLFALQGEIGWKFIIRQIFIQPYAGYNISFGKVKYPAEASSRLPEEISKYGFINFGLSLGFIF